MQVFKIFIHLMPIIFQHDAGRGWRTGTGQGGAVSFWALNDQSN